MPYNDASTGELLQLKTSTQILEQILDDLDKAAELLVNDPIRTRGIDTLLTFDQAHDFYQLHRNYRMNFYAVKAMQARVHLWKGNHREAADAALVVIDAQNSTTPNGRLFPWITHVDISTGFNPDRIFSTEIIFGIRSRNMYNNYDQFFAPTLNPANELAPLSQRLDVVFETTGAGWSDYRFDPIWRDAGADKGYRVFWKYARPNDRQQPDPEIRRRAARTEFFQPLIRISEMYYIVAESKLALGEGTPQSIWNNYLNVVRIARNIGTAEPFLGDADRLREEIRKEYQKEFWGEGQLFFYYKRLNYTTIPDALEAVGNVPTIIYRLPIPEAEQIARGN
jgi:hypothetical protein